MLINASKLQNCPVLSLHVGSKIASVVTPIVDPNSLRIIACRVAGPLIGREAGEILPMDSVREFSRLGMILDSTDDLVEPDDIIRIRDILKLNFSLIGLKVETKNGAKLGKVSDYTVNPETWEVQQLVVQRPFLKSLLDPELLIPRAQIVEVDDYKVIVKSEKDAQPSKEKVEPPTFTPNFINPFREPEFEHSAKEDE